MGPLNLEPVLTSYNRPIDFLLLGRYRMCVTQRDKGVSLDITECQPQSNGQKLNPLKQLPIELIQSIASTLSLPAAASFTLICRRVSLSLGSQYLNQLREKGDPERLEFVKLLERDLPRHILCYKCKVLHSRKQRQPPIPTLCRIADIKSYQRLYIGPEFDSITFLLAMKLHRHGLDSSEHLYKLTGSGTIPSPTHIRHWESIPRIVNGHFLLRRQTWILLRTTTNKIAFNTNHCCVCPDWYSGPSYFPSIHSSRQKVAAAGPTRLYRLLACRASHLDNAELNSSCPGCAGLIKCDYCPTEFHVDTKEFNGHGVALVITRWLDLGEGRDLQDGWYQSHLWRYKGQPVSFEQGSIKAAYEGGDSNTEKLLTPKYGMEKFKHAGDTSSTCCLAHAPGGLWGSMLATENKKNAPDISGIPPRLS